MIYDKQADLPISFQGHTLEIATFTLNRVPSKSIQKIPYEIWTGKCPNLSFIKIWSCEAYVKHLASDKLGPKSDKCYFVGYPKKTKGYYFYNPIEGKVFIARTGIFLETEFISRRTSGSKIELEEVQDSQNNIEPKMELEQRPQDVVEQEPA